jgi:hypothetical protein
VFVADFAEGVGGGGADFGGFVEEEGDELGDGSGGAKLTECADDGEAHEGAGVGELGEEVGEGGLKFKASEGFSGFGADLGFGVGEGLAEGVEDELLLFEVLQHGRFLSY